MNNLRIATPYWDQLSKAERGQLISYASTQKLGSRCYVLSEGTVAVVRVSPVYPGVSKSAPLVATILTLYAPHGLLAITMLPHTLGQDADPIAGLDSVNLPPIGKTSPASSQLDSKLVIPKGGTLIFAGGDIGISLGSGSTTGSSVPTRGYTVRWAQTKARGLIVSRPVDVIYKPPGVQMPVHLAALNHKSLVYSEGHDVRLNPYKVDGLGGGKYIAYRPSAVRTTAYSGALLMPDYKKPTGTSVGVVAVGAGCNSSDVPVITLDYSVDETGTYYSQRDVMHRITGTRHITHGYVKDSVQFILYKHWEEYEGGPSLVTARIPSGGRMFYNYSQSESSVGWGVTGRGPTAGYGTQNNPLKYKFQGDFSSEFEKPGWSHSTTDSYPLSGGGTITEEDYSACLTPKYWAFVDSFPKGEWRPTAEEIGPCSDTNKNIYQRAVQPEHSFVSSTVGGVWQYACGDGDPGLPDMTDTMRGEIIGVASAIGAMMSSCTPKSIIFKDEDGGPGTGLPPGFVPKVTYTAKETRYFVSDVLAWGEVPENNATTPEPNLLAVVYKRETTGKGEFHWPPELEDDQDAPYLPDFANQSVRTRIWFELNGGQILSAGIPGERYRPPHIFAGLIPSIDPNVMGVCCWWSSEGQSLYDVNYQIIESNLTSKKISFTLVYANGGTKTYPLTTMNKFLAKIALVGHMGVTRESFITKGQLIQHHSATDHLCDYYWVDTRPLSTSGWWYSNGCIYNKDDTSQCWWLDGHKLVTLDEFKNPMGSVGCSTMKKPGYKVPPASESDLEHFKPTPMEFTRIAEGDSTIVTIESGTIAAKGGQDVVSEMNKAERKYTIATRQGTVAPFVRQEP